MKKTIKIVSISIGILLLLLIIAPIVATQFIDPNDYKPEISQLIKDSTGRTLTINGDINYSLFPWLGISLGELQISNSKVKGFSKRPFAKIKSADVRIKILPLLSSNIEVDKVVLSGLNLSLEKNKHGVSNWDDLVKKSKATQKTKAKQPTRKSDTKATKTNSKVDFILPAIAGVELINANVIWNDKQLNQRYEIKDFNFTTGIIANNTPTNIEIAFSFKATQPKLTGKTSLTAKLEFDITSQSLMVNNLELTQEINQQIQKPNDLTIKLTVDKLTTNIKKQTASVSKLNLSVLDIDLTGSFKARNILTDVSVTGDLATNEFNPTELLKTLEIALPKMADTKVLQKAKLNLNISANTNKVSIPKLAVTFDDTKLTGNLSLANFNKPKLRYKLHINEINVDRYLPPPPKISKAAKKQSTKASSKSTAVATKNTAPVAIALPVDLMRSLDIKGTMTLGKTTVSKLHSKDIKLSLLAKNGVIRAYPISAKMYKGQYHGDITLNVQKKIPMITMNETIKGVSFEPLVKDYMGKDYLSGIGSATAKLTTKGLNTAQFTKNLNGTASFNIKDAKIKYLKPSNGFYNEIERQKSKYTKKTYKKKQGKDNPDVFKVMKGSVNIIKGVAHNKDFYTESSRVNLTGNGNVDLVKQNVNYNLNIFLNKPKTGDKGFDAYLKKNPITNHIYGPFDNLSYNNFNIGKLVKGYLKEKLKSDVDKKIAAAKAKLKAKQKEEEKKAKEKLKKSFEKKLKKLFK